MAENPAGIKFPFRFAASGSVRLAEGAEKVASNLEAIAKTALLERLIRKGVGTVGYRLVLRNADETARRATKGLIREAIVRHEPRALLRSLEVSAVDTDTGRAVFVDGVFIFRQTGEESTFRTQIA